MTQINPWMCPKGAQVELSRERCVPKVLKLSSEVSECKPLQGGGARGGGSGERSARHGGQCRRSGGSLYQHRRSRQALGVDARDVSCGCQRARRRRRRRRAGGVTSGGPRENTFQESHRPHPAALRAGGGNRPHATARHRGRVGTANRGLHSSTFQLNLSRLGHTSACPPV